MKTRLVVPLVGLAMSFVLPSFAQQKDVADPQTTQKILAMGKVNDEATNNNDATAVAAQYTRDAVFVTTEGPIIGRQAIQNWFSEICKWWHPKNHIFKLDGNAPHVIGTAGNELWATGEWSEVSCKSDVAKAGDPQRASDILVRVVKREHLPSHLLPEAFAVDLVQSYSHHQIAEAEAHHPPVRNSGVHRGSPRRRVFLIFGPWAAH